MKKTIHCCTKCGKEVITSRGEVAKYRTIEFRIGQFDSDYLDPSSSNSLMLNRLYLCPDCYTKIGISSEDKNNKVSVQSKEYTSVAEELYEIFAEMVREINSEQ